MSLLSNFNTYNQLSIQYRLLNILEQLAFFCKYFIKSFHFLMNNMCVILLFLNNDLTYTSIIISQIHLHIYHIHQVN